MTSLAGKTAIVTGVAQGLGYAIAHAYAREGLRIVLMDVEHDKLEQLETELRDIGADCLAIPVDLADATETQRAVDTALAHYGAPRVMVHNAALLKERSMLEISTAQWQKEVNIILQAAFILSKAVWQSMINAGGGSIVYVSSGSGIKGFVKEVAYCPAKHGQEGLMKVLALEGQLFNIAVNTITPGVPIKTPMSEENYSDELKQKWVDPAFLAPAFAHLAQFTAQNGTTGERLNAWEIAQSLQNQP